MQVALMEGYPEKCYVLAFIVPMRIKYHAGCKNTGLNMSFDAGPPAIDVIPEVRGNIGPTAICLGV